MPFLILKHCFANLVFHHHSHNIDELASPCHILFSAHSIMDEIV